MTGKTLTVVLFASLSPLLAGAGSCKGGGGPVCPRSAAALVIPEDGGGDRTVGAVRVDVRSDRFIVTATMDDERYHMRDAWMTFYDHDNGITGQSEDVETRHLELTVPCLESDCRNHCGNLIAVRTDIVIGWSSRDHVRSVTSEFSFTLSCDGPERVPVFAAAPGGGDGGGGDRSCTRE